MSASLGEVEIASKQCEPSPNGEATANLAAKAKVVIAVGLFSILVAFGIAVAGLAVAKHDNCDLQQVLQLERRVFSWVF